MDNSEAKLILGAYRPGGEDAADPVFAEALERARRDPELGRWLAEQRRFDVAAGAALRGVNPPPGLRESLLAANRLAVSGGRGARRWAIRWLALAAALALFAGGAFLFFGKGRSGGMTGGEFVAAVHGLNARGEISLGKMASDPARLREWLAGRGAPHDFEVPPGLAGRDGIGCQSYSIGGAKVALVCFSLGENRVAHLFVVETRALRDPPGRTPAIYREGGAAAVGWSSGGRTYVLAGMGLGEETLLELI